MKRLLGLLFLSANTALAGPAFDCTKAKSDAEKAICSEENPGLAEQDVALVRLFSALKKDGGHDKVLAAQPAWIKKRDACGADAMCLSARYDERLAALAKEAGDKNGVTGRYGYKLTGEIAAPDSDTGSATIFYGPGGILSGNINSVSGPSFHTCEVAFDNAAAKGNSWVWTDSQASAIDEGKHCLITFTPATDSLRIESEYCLDYCGARGSFDQKYEKLQ